MKVTRQPAHNRIIIACLQRRRHYNKTFDRNTRPREQLSHTYTSSRAIARFCVPTTRTRPPWTAKIEGFLSSSRTTSFGCYSGGCSIVHKVYRYPILSTTTCGSRSRSQMYRARACSVVREKWGKRERGDATR